MNPFTIGGPASARRRQPSPALVIGIAIGLVAAACTAGSTPAPSATSATPTSQASGPGSSIDAAGASPVLGVIDTPESSADGASMESPSPVEPAGPTDQPEATPSPAPTRSPAPGWTKPVHVGPTVGTDGPFCDGLVAGIDTSSRDHVAVECDGKITYAMGIPGGPWTATTFAPPAHRVEYSPQLAFRGDLVYLAYTRIAVEDGGCGDNGLRDVGVYYRTRMQPNGAWSAPIRLGAVNDGIESFRVAGSTIYATVRNRTDGRRYFEVVRAGVTSRYRLPGAIGASSLRIGRDGKARIVYPAAKSLDYAVFDGTSLTTTVIPKTTSRSWMPQLVLGAGNDPEIAWLSMDTGGGCVTESEPTDGLYVGAKRAGTWTSVRISRDLGPASLQVDPATGRVLVLQAAYVGLVLHAQDVGGPWVTTFVRATPTGADQPQLRLDPTNGSMLAAWVAGDGVAVMTYR
jgi:hypothetical protein